MYRIDRGSHSIHFFLLSILLFRTPIPSEGSCMEEEERARENGGLVKSHGRLLLLLRPFLLQKEANSHRNFPEDGGGGKGDM